MLSIVLGTCFHVQPCGYVSASITCWSSIPRQRYRSRGKVPVCKYGSVIKYLGLKISS